MNISEADNMVLGLIDEETLEEYADKIRGYYDSAQKQIATTVDFIKAEFLVEVQGRAEIDLKEYIENKFSKTLYRICKILPASTYTRVYDFKYILSPGAYRVFCYVYPDNITNNTPVDYSFEVSPEAQPAIAYYAAAQCMVTDTDQRPYYAFMDRYNNILQNMSDSKRQNTSINIVKLGGGTNGI